MPSTALTSGTVASVVATSVITLGHSRASWAASVRVSEIWILYPFQNISPVTPQRASVSYGQVSRRWPGGRPSVSFPRRVPPSRPFLAVVRREFCPSTVRNAGTAGS